MKKKNATIYYGLIMAVYSGGFVTLSAFSSLYLLNIGLSNGAVGMLLAIASLISVLLQPPVGALIDNSSKISTKHVMLVFSIAIAVIGLIIILHDGKDIVITTALYGTAVMLLMLAQPFSNALGMDAINYGYPINFSVGRSMGSLGYALCSAAFGRISVMAGYKSVPFAFSLIYLVLVVLVIIYPVKKDGSVVIPQESRKKENPFLFLLKYKRLAAMLFGLIFIYFSHVLLNAFTLQVVTLKNGTSASMGTATAIAAICELITVLLFPFYMKHIKMKNILRISGVFFTLKILCSYLAPNMTVYYGIQVLQMYSWGFIGIGLIYYVNDLVGENDKAQGQAYAGMSFTLASVLATFIGGNIIDKFGVPVMLLVGTVLAALGTLILWIFVEDTERK